MQTLLDLAARMDSLGESIPSSSSDAAKQAATELLRSLVQLTPADTGAAISNWQVGIGSPVGSTIAPHVPSPRGHMVGGVWTHRVDPDITRSANAPVTFEEGLLRIKAKAPGESIYLTNNVPYGARLDSGSSKQAPAGFVDKAIIIVREIVDKALIIRLK